MEGTEFRSWTFPRFIWSFAMRFFFRQRESAVALLLILSLMGAELLSMAHNATVRHVYCFAHRHMMDADEAAAHSHPRFIFRDSGDSGKEDALPGIASSEQEALHRHLHCDKSVFLKSGNIPSACELLILQAAAVRAAQPYDRLAEPAVSLLFLAPKNSPPVCA